MKLLEDVLLLLQAGPRYPTCKGTVMRLQILLQALQQLPLIAWVLLMWKSLMHSFSQGSFIRKRIEKCTRNPRVRRQIFPIVSRCAIWTALSESMKWALVLSLVVLNVHFFSSAGQDVKDPICSISSSPSGYMTLEEVTNLSKSRDQQNHNNPCCKQRM